MEVRIGGELFILDCGTGIRELGIHLMAGGEPVSGHVLLSHSHWDHIQGFPFFAPLFRSGHQFSIFGPQEHSQRLNETLAGQMQYRYFPVGMDQLAASLRYQEMREEQLTIGKVTVGSHYLNHTTLTLAYKLQAHGRTLVYATDTEPFSQHPRAWASSETRSFLHRRDEKLMEFFSGADVLIIDAQYTAKEYPGKLGWGHSTVDYCLDMAISANVGTVVLFHHEPTRIDSAVAILEQLAQKRLEQEAPSMEVLAAAEGVTLELEDVEGDGGPELQRRIPEFHPRVRVAVVGSGDDFVTLAWKALAQDHYDVVAVNDLNALDDGEFADYQPHLVLLQHSFRAWEPSTNSFLQKESRRHIPVIVAVPSGRLEAAQEAFDQGASDVLIEPYAATQLRSRVDAWLLRTGVAVDRRIRGRGDADQESIGVAPV
ncbi:MAG: hypothetical protein KGJ86_08540 [Chloroflexota bacterium]|nr:hypothetical protein [Chloroflexota bacterium]